MDASGEAGVSAPISAIGPRGRRGELTATAIPRGKSQPRLSATSPPSVSSDPSPGLSGTLEAFHGVRKGAAFCNLDTEAAINQLGDPIYAYGHIPSHGWDH